MVLGLYSLILLGDAGLLSILEKGVLGGCGGEGEAAKASFIKTFVGKMRLRNIFIFIYLVLWQW